jgi:glyoxylase-like metal-dependent hydrolase (beta-lactamase superfamily II)
MAEGKKNWRQRVGLNPARIGGHMPYIHRFGIGTLEAAVVSDGPLALPPAAAIHPGLPQAEVEAALAEAFVPAGPLRIEQNILLVDLGGHLVLFDDGMGDSKLFGPDSGRLVRSLAELDIAPAQIDALVLSHAHSDHCWGTMRPDGTPAFPNAMIYMAERELVFWEHYPGSDRDRTVAGVRRHLLPLRERMLFIRDGEEFLPGLHAIAAPGHTPGHMAFVVANAGEALCVLGDAAFLHPISFAHPAAHSAFDTEPEVAAATRARLLGRLADERMRMIGYHAPWPGLGHVLRAQGARAGGGFRYVAEAAAPKP